METIVVLGATLAGLVLAGVGGAVAWRVRRRALAIGALVVGLALVVAADTVPRMLAGRAMPSLPDGVSIALAPTPAAWQAATGGMQIQAVLDPAEVEERLASTLEDTPLADADVALGDGALVVGSHVEIRGREVPLEARVTIEVADGALVATLDSATLAGFPLPAAALEALPGLGEGALGGDVLGGDLDAEVLAASVSPEGVTLTLRA